MNESQLEQLIDFRLQQAQETLLEAEMLLSGSAWRGAVNRAYYAMFYALLALLASRQLGSSRHSAAIALFDREFVKTGLFERELSRSLHLAFADRQSLDYGEVVQADRERAELRLQEAQVFVEAITAFLHTMRR